MRILFLTHSFNSLTQRLFVDLAEEGHEVSIEFDIADSVTEEAVALYQPDIVIAPFLKRAIPDAVWRNNVCLVIHPGIVGDRGPSALDWAIQRGENEWGVTVLQANAVMDGGDIWAAETFPMHMEKKSSLYRNQATEAASRAVKAAVARYLGGGFSPCLLEQWPGARGKERPLMRQADRKINWESDDTHTVLRKIHAADGFPGVHDELFDSPCFLFDAHAEPGMAGLPGALLGWRGHGVVRATRDGAVRIGHVRRPDGEHTFKLPASVAFAAESESLPLLDNAGADGIRYEEADGVGYLYFDFYNGAMSTELCRLLLAAYRKACARPTRVIVLMGGEDFWSNGIHLNLIEAADSPADESWNNIQAMDDLAEAIIRTTSHLTITALAGNAGAGGAFLALTADLVWARPGIVLNPHYKNMGNLYGSELWTYTLPRRVGAEQAQGIMQNRLPLGAEQARRMGIVDACFGTDMESFRNEVKQRALELSAMPDYGERLAAKTGARQRDESIKPLVLYREAELVEMRRNFYGFDPSYHYARYQFVHKTPHAWTPRHLCRHRDIRQS
ncbi:MAG: hydrogenase maturation protein [Betaproteobacteria bacterium]|nr:hydrogenase maturation protein [Betaproteobacteria bacterium]